MGRIRSALLNILLVVLVFEFEYATSDLTSARLFGEHLIALEGSVSLQDVEAQQCAAYGVSCQNGGIWNHVGMLDVIFTRLLQSCCCF